MEIWYLLTISLPSISFAFTINPAMRQRDNRGVVARDDNTCASDPDLQACPTGLPFCCPQKSTCKATTPDNSTVICCPEGQDCQFISPITCDLSQQDASKFPKNPLHTTKLDAELPQCDDQCCPLGFSCQNGNCALTQNESPSPSSSEAPPPPPASTATAPPVVIPPNLQNNRPQTSSTKSSQFPPGAVILGLFLGLAAGAALTFLVLFLLGRRSDRKSANNRSSNNKKLARHSTESFMGTTPRPSSTTIAASSTHHSFASASKHPTPPHPQAPGPKPPPAPSTVSEPMWANEFGPPAHRTDFLLRRGDCSTGLEDRLASRTSTAPAGASSLERGRSRRAMADATAPSNPNTKQQTTAPPRQTSMRERQRMPPLFQAPLKFGLPTTPRPAKRLGDGDANTTKAADATNTTTPQQGTKSANDKVARMLSLSHNSSVEKTQARTEAEKTAPKSDNHANPSESSYTTARTTSKKRDDSQKRPLVGARSESQGSDVTILSDSGDEEDGPEGRGKGKGNVKDNASCETINVLLPPPSVFRTPPPSAGKEGEKRDTTFSDMMKKAGWERGEWKAGR